ncbi:MAG: GTP-binding protein [Opitutaceae bacterium]
MHNVSRRSFIRTGALAAGSMALISGTSSSARVIGANNRLRIAVAGLNGRGKSHIAGWLEQPNVEIAYLIDPDQKVLDRTLKSLAESARLDTCVSVVDASSFFGYFLSSKFLAEAFDDAEEEDEKTVVDLLVDQIEFADVILLNKLDMCTGEMADKIENLLKSLNKTAKIIRCRYSKVPLKEILNTGLFDMEKAVTSSGWLQSLNAPHVPETEEYGIGSFVYRQRRPFHPQRLFELIKTAFLVIERAGEEEEPDEEMDEEEGPCEEAKGDDNDDPAIDDNDDAAMTDDDDDDDADMTEEKRKFQQDEGAACLNSKMGSVFKHVLRSKGFLWIAGKDKFMGEWSHAGIILTVSHRGRWYVDMPEELEQQDEGTRELILKNFHQDKAIGDRRQEIVFIGDFPGIDDKQKLRDALDGCLMNKGEVFDAEADPWEEWV